ncbi:MAG: SRPBCC family protein [Planctomycetaceae bacterium]
MITLIEREFTVNVGLEQAWDHLARIEQWPSWAPHIKRIELEPSGKLKPRSQGVIHLTNGMKPVFRVTAFHRPQSWKWVGGFLWVRVHYDHQFEALNGAHTKLVWMIEAEGFGATILGRPFALKYRRHLERAIPRLIREMNARTTSD